MKEFDRLWKKLGSKKYREEFVAAQVKRGIPFQIRKLMKQQGLSQEELARRAGLTQGVVSRAADPEYGNLTLNTIIRVAAGLDVAFVGRFVPFTDLGDWFLNLSNEKEVQTYEKEDADKAKPKQPQRELGRIPSDQIEQPSQFGVHQGGAERTADKNKNSQAHGFTPPPPAILPGAEQALCA